MGCIIQKPCSVIYIYWQQCLPMLQADSHDLPMLQADSNVYQCCKLKAMIYQCCKLTAMNHQLLQADCHLHQLCNLTTKYTTAAIWQPYLPVLQSDSHSYQCCNLTAMHINAASWQPGLSMLQSDSYGHAGLFNSTLTTAGWFNPYQLTTPKMLNNMWFLSSNINCFYY